MKSIKSRNISSVKCHSIKVTKTENYDRDKDRDKDRGKLIESACLLVKDRDRDRGKLVEFACLLVTIRRSCLEEGLRRSVLRAGI